jgi:hypothetical protein
MPRVLAAEAAILAHLQPFGGLPLVLGRAVIPAFALGTRQGNDVAHLLCSLQFSVLSYQFSVVLKLKTDN